MVDFEERNHSGQLAFLGWPGLHHDYSQEHDFYYSYVIEDDITMMVIMHLMTVMIIQALEQTMSMRQRKRRETAFEDSNQSESSLTSESSNLAATLTSSLVRSIKTGLETLEKMGREGTPEQVSCLLRQELLTIICHMHNKSYWL